jgi:hypothetical protein
MNNELTTMESVDVTARIASALAASGYYKDIREASQAFVKLQIAREMGLGMKGISDVHIVEGKPTLSYQLILSKVRMFTGPHGTDRYSFRYSRRDDECVEIEWLINNEVVGTSKCDTEDAKRMGLAGRGTWQKYPRQMRTARAVTEGVNAFMPEVIGGSIYTPDELGFESGNNGGEGGDFPSKVASSVVSLPSSNTLTIKASDEERDEIVETMISEAVLVLDAAEEDGDGKVIDPTPAWVEAAGAFFASLAPEKKAEYGKILRIEGYLPEGKITQAKVCEALADSLGPRCLELDIVMSELSA